MVGSWDLHQGAKAVPNSTKFLVDAEIVQNDAQHTSAGSLDHWITNGSLDHWITMDVLIAINGSPMDHHVNFHGQSMAPHHFNGGAF